ncbi:hypothetical protein GCM10027614_84190 [Micromonospora vulcania]
MKVNCPDLVLRHVCFIPKTNKGGVSYGSLYRSSWKVSRRLGISLSGTGKELERRPYAPGQHYQLNVKNLRIWFATS